MKFLVVFLALFSSMNSTNKSSYIKGDETLLHYIFRDATVKSEKPPLLILLHGVGSNEQDLFSFANKLPTKFLVVSARGPYVKGNNSYAWYDVDFSTGKPVINRVQAEKSRLVLLQFISQLKSKHNFDEKRVYVCGFSQGAIMSYSLGLTKPDKIKGIAVMSGRLLDEVKPNINRSARLKDLQVFISHGANDNVLGIHYAKESLAYLNELGIHPLFKEYPEGHGINAQMLSDLITWLNDK